MGKLGFYCFFLVMMLSSCDKDKTSDPSSSKLDGRWTLISIKDKSTSQMLAAPQGSAGKVFLQIEGNKFMGQTLVNNIYDGEFAQENSNIIRINTYSMTKVGESEWGSAFLTVLSACFIQSFSPCTPSSITWLSPTTIRIDSPLRFVITMEKF